MRTAVGARTLGWQCRACHVGDLTGFASALVLAIVTLGIGVMSFQRFFEPIRIACV